MSPNEDYVPPDLRQLIEQFLGDATPEELGRLVAGMGPGTEPGSAPVAPDFWKTPKPQLHPVPETTRGFLIRVDLQHTKPPVWRRIEVPGDITLPRLHDLLQATMGWTDSHLHRFRTGAAYNSPQFITPFDEDEGDDGMFEDGVRLDQLVASAGDRLWYEYDFGDSWEHVLRVEKVLATPPETPRCLKGALACPPEDCGGVWGYGEIAAWVRSGYDAESLPEQFDSAEDARGWLPPGWDPDAFDVAETNEAIAVALADPVPVTEELASLLDASRRRGSRLLRDALSVPASFGPTEVGAEDAARLTEPFRVLLDVIGEGANLTAAGYLKPADVERIAGATGVTQWWIGKVNREDQTFPVARLRDVARSLGLISVRKGRIAPTQAAKRCEGDPGALVNHIVGRLPLGRKPAERQAGWAALAVVGGETPAQRWHQDISDLMSDLGWRSGLDGFSAPPADSPTLDVLELLAGETRTGRGLSGIDPAVAAAARAAMRRP